MNGNKSSEYKKSILISSCIGFVIIAEISSQLLGFGTLNPETGSYSLGVNLEAALLALGLPTAVYTASRTMVKTKKQNPDPAPIEKAALVTALNQIFKNNKENGN